jgi:RNA polymerase primary sigma factor
MEITTPVPTEPKESSLVIPTDLAANLKSNATLIITSAQKSGAISTREITAMLQPAAVSDRYRLKTTISLLDGFLAGIGITLARGKIDLEKRVLPLPAFAHRPTLSLRFRALRDLDLKFADSLIGGNDSEEYSEFSLYEEVMQRFPVLNYPDTVELFKRRTAGDMEAQYLLILHNLRLVFSWGYKYQGRGIDLADLVQEGVLGLLIAIEKFDWQKGFRLSTYASNWIRQKMQAVIRDKARTIRLPAYFNEKYHVIRRVDEALQKELGREPTYAELAERSGIGASIISKMFGVIKSTETSSIDDQIGSDENSGERHGMTPDTKIVSPSDILDAKETLQEAVTEVRKLLIKLSLLPRFDDRWCLIFKMRYGLDGTFFSRPTLEVVGQKFGVTRERIRQILDACWERLIQAGVHEDEEWLLAKLNQIEELESITGVLAKV